MNNKPIIYLEKDLFTEDERQDTSSIISQYFDIREIDMMSIVSSRINPVSIRHALFGRYSLNIAKYIGKKFKEFDALNWLPALRNYTLSPKNTYFNDLKFFIDHYSAFDFPLFLRPTNGFKTFSGQVFPSKDKLIEEYNFIQKNKNIDGTVMCMSSPVKKINKEWRTIFINNQYCSGSQYMVNDELVISSEVPEHVIWFAKEIAKHAYFQNISNFCVDVCESRGSLYLLEINSFECSSFYGADLNKIYQTWKDTYNE